MKVIVSSTSGEPIYEQIKNQIRAAVLGGELKAGEALPSLRRLAKELRVSVLTVTRAYSELADEGIVQNVQGKGTFVMDKGNELMVRQLTAQVRENLDGAAKAAMAAGIPLDRLERMLGEAYADVNGAAETQADGAAGPTSNGITPPTNEGARP